MRSTLASDDQSYAVEQRRHAAAQTGERLPWSRAALFMLALCAVLWFGLIRLVGLLIG